MNDMRTITVRLKPGQYFREGVEEVVARHGVAAGVSSSRQWVACDTRFYVCPNRIQASIP